MPTQCSATQFDFARVGGRGVVASFDGGAITSDAGGVLLQATDRAIGLVDRFAACFVDRRRGDLIEHSVRTLVGQRVFGIALGYEDLNDHDHLRHDPVMAVLAGKLEARRQDCAPVAGKSTLNRLELSRPEPTRYHKISHDPPAIERLLVDLFIEAHARPPGQIVLDLDATDDLVHGHQEGRFFHGYYKGYCYLPLYIFCGRHLLAAKLRRANIDASAGAKDEVARIVGQIRQRWPRTRILLRADSGFARDDLMALRSLCDRVLRTRARRSAAGASTTGSTSSSAWPATPGWSSGSASTSPGPRTKPVPQANRPGASPTSAGRRAIAGAASAGSSPRPNGCRGAARKAPIPGSSSPP